MLRFSIFLLFTIQLFSASAQYSISTLKKDAGVHTDWRPGSPGVYDPVVNKTFVTWMGADSDIFVAAFDHTTRTFSEAKVVGTSSFDKHHYPQMIQAADGRLIIWHGAHNTDLKQSKAPTPHSIAGTWTDRFIDQASKASYPYPIKLDNGTIYVFFRRTDRTVNRPAAFIKSTNHGETWTELKKIIKHERNDGLNEIYMGKVVYEPTHDGIDERIHFVWTIAGGPEATDHNNYRRNAYHAYLKPSNDHLYSADGIDLGALIDEFESEDHCVVYDTGAPDYNQDEHATSKLTPLVLWDENGKITVHHNTEDWEGNRSSIASNWDGFSWSHIIMPFATVRDMYKVRPGHYRRFHASGSSFTMVETTDFGASWTVKETMPIHGIEGSAHKFLLIENHHPDLIAVATERTSSDPDTHAIEDKDIYFMGSPGEVIEAESFEGQSGFQPFIVYSDDNASNGSYIKTTAAHETQSAPGSGRLQIDFKKSALSDIVLRTRGLAAGSNSNSFWYQINSDPWNVWHFSLDGISSQYQYDERVLSSLSTGDHKMTVAYRESATRLDRFEIFGQYDVTYEIESAIDQPDFSPLTIKNNSGASNGKYVKSSQSSIGSAPSTGHASFGFINKASAHVLLRIRVISSSTSSNSIWYRIDDDSWQPWYFNNVQSTWQWYEKTISGLSNDYHTLTLAYREKNTLLDELEVKLIVSSAAREILIAEDQHEEIMVFPNPVSDQIRIIFPKTLDREVNISLKNLSGKVVRSQTVHVQQKLELPVRGLPVGMYFLEITGQEALFKILIK